MNAKPDFLEQRLLKVFPVDQWSYRRVCLATSGGPDSVAMVRAMASIAEQNGIRDKLMIVTVNHRLRGSESEGDVAFVRNFGRKLRLPVDVRTVDSNVLKEETRRLGSLESAARNLRYQLLCDAAHEFSARYIVTAHHAGDQLETILFRLFRGSGVEGLRGVAPIRALDASLTLVRPMLEITREEILAYLEKLKQDYRIDSSNISSVFTRNRIRNELVPVLNDVFPNRWQNALLRLAEQSDEINALLEAHVDELEYELRANNEREKRYRQTLCSLNAVLPGFGKTSQNSIDIPLSPLQKVPNEILKRYFRRLWRRLNWPLRDMGYEEWNRLAEAVKEKKATQQFPGNVALLFISEDTIRLEQLKNQNKIG